MENVKINLEDEWDFGFTTHSEQEVVLAEEVTAAQDKAMAMYKAIIPLLNNLSKDADKNAYIHWPDRNVKIAKFKKQLEKILNS